MAGKAVTEALRFLPHKRYQILRQLGKQAGRQTLLAHDLKWDEPVVIKLLTLNNALDGSDLERVKQDAEVLKTLSHSQIPSYLDCFALTIRDVQHLVLVQRYVEGRSLHDYLQQGRQFTEVEIKECAIALLSILVYLHGQQPAVLHGDIKPSNIRISDRSDYSMSHLYLVDFGLLQTPMRQNRHGITGRDTPRFRQPQTWRKRRTPVLDLYGVGMVAIALAMGQTLANGSQKTLNQHLKVSAQLSDSFIQWLNRMTDKHPDRRFSSAQSALDALIHLPLSPKTAPDHSISVATILWNVVWRSAELGVQWGSLLGVFVGSSTIVITLMEPGDFSPLTLLTNLGLGVLAGLFPGLCLGTLNGIVLGLLTVSCFYPLRHRRPYRRWLQITSAFVVGTSTLLISMLAVNELALLWILLPICTIVALAAGLASQDIADWYEDSLNGERP